MDTVARSFPLLFIWLVLAWLVIFVSILVVLDVSKLS